MSATSARKLFLSCRTQPLPPAGTQSKGALPFSPLHSGTTSEKSLPGRPKLKVAWKAASLWCLLISAPPLCPNTGSLKGPATSVGFSSQPCLLTSFFLLFAHLRWHTWPQRSPALTSLVCVHGRLPPASAHPPVSPDLTLKAEEKQPIAT